jgi:alpha-1,6-mannosyltransferase
MPTGRFSVSLRSCLLAAGATEAVLISLWFLPPGSPSTLGFIVAQALVWTVYGIVVWRARADSAPSRPSSVHVILGAAVLFRLTLVAHPPVGSDDIYRYVWDGHIALNGINPFSYAPHDPALARYATNSLPALINHPELKSAYPAAAQLFFLLSNLLFGPSIPCFKALLVMVDLMSLYLMLKALRLFDLPAHLVLLYAWSPIPLFYGALDGHIDVLGIPFLLMTLILLKRRRFVASGLALGGAALVKIHPVLMAPFLFVREKGWRNAWVVLVPVAVFAAGIVAYSEPTHGWFEAMTVMGKHWEFNSAFFTAAYGLTGNNQTAHLVSNAALLLWIAWLSIRDVSAVEKYFLGFLGFVVLGPTAHPWYFLWIAALLVFRWSVPALVLLAMTNLSNIVVYRYHTTGVWLDDPALVAVEYGVPLILAVAMAAVRRRRGAAPGGGGRT